MWGELDGLNLITLKGCLMPACQVYDFDNFIKGYITGGPLSTAGFHVGGGGGQSVLTCSPLHT
eukprot:9211443-Karenia_brevis.AAC.1